MLIPTKDIKVSRNEGRIFCLRVVLPVYAGLVHDFQETSPEMSIGIKTRNC